MIMNLPLTTITVVFPLLLAYLAPPPCAHAFVVVRPLVGGHATTIAKATTATAPSDVVVVKSSSSFESSSSAAKEEETTTFITQEDITTTTTPRPGQWENEIFDCDENAQFWENFQIDGLESLEQNLQSLNDIGLSFTSQGPNALSFWFRHVGRSTYFATNAVLGSLGFALHERLVKNGESRAASDDGDVNVLPFANLNGQSGSRLLLEAALCYQQDYREIQAGTYKEPWDMVLFSHRQSSPLNVVTQTSRFVREAIGTLGRRKRATDADRSIWISDAPTSTNGNKLYPDYYRTAFHYQTDGWMSQESANVYETSTETLFLGRQDAMQRASLKPLMDLAKKRKESDGNKPLRILEVACGTGRFLTFIRDNLPLDTEYTAVDLSPYYLEAARNNDKYWRSTTRQRQQERNSRNNDPVELAPAQFVQAQAENLPFDDESFDAVVCVYLFHELPRKVRAQAGAEMARVLKSDGGIVVLTDSIQRGDRPVLDELMGNFGNFNEPYYVDYVQDFLPDHFTRAGLTPMTKTLRSSTKSLSFRKQ